ncbi:uncharacterized protein T551_00764 [Pneumocystis jirovecii RU7]|uniref:Uncharacterized protein n=1 Tax=Pneumocystis jirovecii (strain RU7) TaxID=1408657 RepID=A0A0W4ZUM2_PNEJ7|nr:uncharacterized protein T551_00764 [Pneumocystis jirovecii RU7]KTW32082.1 hypothetical protein T551_00764 [Pneumocystis jirovecii RU7]
MYDYPVNYHKQLHGQCKQRSYGNVYHDSCKNYGSNEHIRMYSDEQMPCKHRLYPDKTYNMHHGKAEKDHVNYIQVVSTPGHGGYCGEKQLYYNNYQIKVPEFVDKSNGGRKPYVNTMKDSSYWNKIYPCYPYSRDTYMKWMYSGGTNSIWGFSDTHLPYRRPNPRHFGSAEYLNRKAGCIDQIALHNRDAPCHRYPLSEPNDISWEVPTRRIRNNISMPNIGSQFKRQNNMNYPCRPHNAIDPLYHKASFMNLPVPTTTIKGSIYGVESANRRLNDDSVSLFCDDSFSSSCYEGRDIESPRVILSRNINSINQLAPHSVTENLYISNDIEVIDTKNSKSPHDSEKKIQEMHKNHKNENSNGNSTSSYKKKQKKSKSSFDGLSSIYKYGIDKENILKYKEKIKKSFSSSNESLLHKKSFQNGMQPNTANAQKTLHEKNDDINWPLNTFNENTFQNHMPKNNQKLTRSNIELSSLQAHDAAVINNGKSNNEQKFKLFSLSHEKLGINGLDNDKNDINTGTHKLNKKKASGYINDLKQETLPIFSQFSSITNAGFQKNNKPANILHESNYESKTSSQALNKDIDKKITFSDLKGLQDQVYCANDPQTQLKYAKKLIQVASDLSNDNMKDTKFVKKNKEKYLSDAYSIIKGLVNSSSPYPEAMFFLANCYGDGTFGLPIDHKQAYTLYYSASKYKHSQSIYRTAVCLEIGMGVKKNQEKAVQYYQKAASLGNVKAMYKIGIILLNGLLKQTKNPKKAIFWLKKASELADEENPHALHELAILYEKDNEGICIVTRDEKHSFELYTKAAHLMYPPSQVRLAYAYEHGVLGCDVDPKKSITWYSRAAEKGNPDAELGLSGWYLTGAEGVLEQSDREAYLWAKKAAEKGLTKAEYAVGYYLEAGIGVKSNRTEAKMWYKRAARKGLVRAIERLYELKKLGSNSKIPDKIYNRWQLTRMFDCSIL